MNAASKAIAAHGLKRRALSLGAVKAFDQLLQFLLPVVLVRCLDAATFGEYRLLWLAVGTVIAVATLNMPGALYFFVPRSDPPARRLYIHQTVAYLAAAGLVCAFAVSPWNPLLPEAAQPLTRHGALVPAFIALWLTSLLLDYLPTIDERIPWQAYATICVSLARALLLAAGAWLTGDMQVLLWLLLLVATLKLSLLAVYLHRHHGLGPPWFRRKAFAEQFRYAAPFGVSSSLYSLRSQADQWVAASLFTLHSFAAFSIAAILGQLVNVVRASVVEAFLPSMSRMQAAGDVRSMMEMNSRANVMVGTALYPLLGFVFVFAEDIVTVVYTAAYVDAAPVMRVYAAGMALLVVEVGTLLLLLRQGPFALCVNSVTLAVSALVSWYAAQRFGLAGAAAGSVAALYLDRAVTLRRIASCAGVPFRELQHWRSLGVLIAFTLLAAAAAWGAVELYFSAAAPLARLAAGAVVLAAVYAALNLGRVPR